MKIFRNTQKTEFLKSIPTASLDSKDDKLASKMKFNFSYIDTTQEAGQNIEDWSEGQLHKFFKKLIDYSRENIEYWKNIRIGSGKKRNSVCVIYGNFPSNSLFKHPKNVPHQVLWGRFRLEHSVRLIGFVVPNEYHEKRHDGNGKLFDKNTFYVVFLDSLHNFYRN